ncbi:serine/threonine-protein kinase [Actinomadura sp. DC4]|uniref:serine/threonine-protein kinase n=1 Tax=Actinomadura sp. DC4 TaxID=3055069 RepID=UPI0025AEFC5B|nr:serine/threonine-protein kinase [Actinomadura sp. DC4]MDN3351867.1 serine/threonine-protein kinase [Actinomadura sp. DC4]
MPFGEGSVLGRRYRLLSQVGRGGMGRVWHAHDDLLHRDVAVKEVIFPPGLTASDREVLYERTLREARSAARLTHPGIVTVHDVVEEDGRPWIVMEFVRAPSLQEVIDGEGRLPVTRVADIGVQMLAALRVAHASGVLHRDVKPANVLLDSRADGSTRVVITDFGIARIDGDATLTQTGLVLGSPAYIAPERARGDGASPASDLWALGATLYAACEGRSPHDRVEAMAALTAVLNEEPDPPRYAGPLGPLMMGLLVKDPAQRVTADQAAADLARAARGEVPAPATGPAETWHDIPDTARVPQSWTSEFGSGASPAPRFDETVREFEEPVPPPSQEAPPKQRPKALLIVVAVLVVAAVIAAAVLLTRHSAKGSPGGPSPSPSATPKTTPSPTATPAPTLPPGFHWSTGPDGSRVAVPAGWTRQVVGASSVRWSLASTGEQIQMDTIPWGVADPVEHWRNFASEVRTKNTVPGFAVTRLGDRFTARGWPAADLFYNWSTRDHGTMRAVDRGFTANGRQYAILVTAPVAYWDKDAGYLSSIFESFQPAH